MQNKKEEIKITESTIIERWNWCLELIEKSYENFEKRNIEKFQQLLKDASSALYETIEWSIKYYLKINLSDLLFNNQASNIISGNLPALINVIKNENRFKNFMQSNNFQLQKIKDHKKPARNVHVHDGEIPNFSAFIEVVCIFEEMLKFIIGINLNRLNQIPNKELTNTEISNFQRTGWQELKSVCKSFSSYRDYILVIDDIELPVEAKYLTMLPFKFIIDFNQDSHIKGLLSHFDGNKSLHIITSSDNVIPSSKNACYYLLPLGKNDRPETRETDYKKWLTSKKVIFDNQIRSILKVCENKPIDIIFFISSERYLKFIRNLCDSLSSLGESISFIFCSNKDLLNDLSDYNGHIIQTNIKEILDGIYSYSNEFSIINKTENIKIPSLSNGLIAIENKDYLYLAEDLEIIYDNVQISEKNSLEENYKEIYYKGGDITYNNLFERHDIERDYVKNITKKILNDLNSRIISRINLFYFPGQGATTLSRRIAWDLHLEFPVALLKSYSPIDTIEKIYKLFKTTDLPPLILAETNIVNTDFIESLYNQIKARNFPCVIFQVTRKIHFRETKSSRTFIIDEGLSDNELELFVRKYSEISPLKKLELEAIKKPINKEMRNPFCIGLIAFESNFKKLGAYVSDSAKNSSELSNKILLYSSFIYFFGHSSTPAQFFSNLLSLPASNIVNLMDFISIDSIRLLYINTENSIRPIHYQVAKEILEYFLRKNSDSDESWTWNLGELCKEIIDYSSSVYNNSASNTTSLDIIRKIFIERDNESLLGKEFGDRFSSVIEKLNTKEMKLEVFTSLTKKFPNEPHFWAHLARFYSIIEKRYSDALINVENAINLSSKEDGSLFHMKGMCLRELIYQEYSSNADLRNILRFYNEAKHCFSKAIELNKFSEFGYISLILVIPPFLVTTKNGR